MTIYYSLTFLLLSAEMVTFCILVFPLPWTIRKKLFGFLSTSPIVAKFAYGLKISFIFVAILFADALQRMFRATAEVDAARHTPAVGDIRSNTDLHARKFYSERNVYLTGFCLFLSLVLTRTFSIVLELIHVQEEYGKLKKSSGDVDVDTLKDRVAELETKERDFEVLKKQAKQQGVEYDRLADEYNKATGANSNKKAD